ncbi:hypothetical protein [Rhizobium sp. SU303]|uniref:hypothetical protein n=1 Tax=Rhizobium sp. SU303 TaxID=3138065 RepID=UPI001E3E0A19|nr:hypothetical protein [Rhizobium leguminosarum]UFW77935.1 hypothetical protein RlegSU303_22300 [Rhizobium leguminosarum bv. viciae]
MTESSLWEVEELSSHLFIHFDVEDHFLKLDTFIQTAESARDIITALDETFFQGSLKFDLIVLPPDDGSFLTKLVVWVSAGTTAVFAFLNSDVGAAYVEGLTGKSPVEWAQELGQDHRERVQEAYEMIEPSEDDPQDTSEPTHAYAIDAIPDSDPGACRSSEKIIVAMTRGVLEKENKELSKIGMEVGLAKALDARSEFYVACLNNRKVKRIGFTPTMTSRFLAVLLPNGLRSPLVKKKKRNHRSGR